MMPLTRETLEALLIDRAVGELAPDVEALLTAYLNQDPAAAQAARQVEETMDLARQVVALPRTENLPEPRFQPARWRAWVLPAWHQLFHRYGWAAGIAAGLAVGGWLAALQWRQHDARVAATRMVRQRTAAVVATVTSPAPAPAATTFWTARPWLQKREPVAAKSQYSLVWDSPAKKPRIKENL
jgi:anti-sigma factor RsiW